MKFAAVYLIVWGLCPAFSFLVSDSELFSNADTFAIDSCQDFALKVSLNSYWIFCEIMKWHTSFIFFTIRIITSIFFLCFSMTSQPRREDCNSVRPEDWNPRIPVGISPVSKHLHCLHRCTTMTPCPPPWTPTLFRPVAVGAFFTQRPTF